MIDKIRFIDTLKNYDITLSQNQLLQLDKFAEILIEYNQKVNLTAITDSLGVENKHFLDSLLFAMNPIVKGSVIDVGTGAGFPGIVAKIYKPQIDLTLLEPTGKRCVFLEYALKQLGIKATVLKERAEEAARKKYREQYDIATARAVADLKILSEYCVPFVKVGGYFIAMKSKSEAEASDALPAIEKLGAKHIETQEFLLPDKSNRSIIICQKQTLTLPHYPRNGGKIIKSPL